MAGRVETNFTRLLHRCETMASEKKLNDWRLEKYVGTLQEYLSELRKLSTNRPAQEMLTEYTHKVEFLKGLIETEKLSSSSEKANLLVPAPRMTESSAPSRDLHLQTKARYQKDMRDELLGKSGEDVRQRKSGHGAEGATSTKEDIDTVIKHHQEIQEKLAEEMLHLTKNMKEHASAAGRIVRKDTERLGESTKMADANYSKLRVESERLDQHARKSCSWWIWIMLALVIFTFVWMVLFMKMFPKR